jgi:hypothetical protein
MSHRPDEFDGLRKVLVLKRHEQPPPGYFVHFADKVVARIEAEGLVRHGSWWQRVWVSIQSGPVVACSYGCMVAGLLVVGVGISQSVEPDPGAPAVVMGSPWETQPRSLAVSTPGNVVFTRRVIEPTAADSSFTPVVSGSAPDFLFDGSLLKARPASYSLR